MGTKDAVTHKIIAAGPILGPRVGNVPRERVLWVLLFRKNHLRLHSF